MPRFRPQALALAALALLGAGLARLPAAHTGTLTLDVPDAQLDIPGMTPVVTARKWLSRSGWGDLLLFRQPSSSGYPSTDPPGFSGNNHIGSASYTLT